jgi:transcriptional regulator with XRE-family HTH domain
VEDPRFGSYIRAERRRRGLRQFDVAGRAGTTQQTVSELERGRAGELTVAMVRQVCRALEVTVLLAPRSRGPEPDRLLDARHARLVQAGIGLLSADWVVVPEYTFNRYGDRGSVDVLAWHAAARALLLVEVKSELRDVQAMLRSMDVKARVVPGIVSGERGWRPSIVGSVLLLPGESAARRSVAGLGRVFEAALPARTVEVRRWICRPSGGLRGIWFVADTPTRRVIRNPGGSGRVRVAAKAASTLDRSRGVP